MKVKSVGNETRVFRFCSRRNEPYDVQFEVNVGVL